MSRRDHRLDPAAYVEVAHHFHVPGRRARGEIIEDPVDRALVEMPSLRKLQRYSLRLLSSMHFSPGTYVMRIVPKSGAPPCSKESSAASLSIPPTGQSDVNSGHSR